MRNTIKKHQDFLTPDDTPVARNAFFIIRTKSAKYQKDPRFGLIATKRTFKHAVDRNRAKRLLRVWIAKNENFLISDMDYIFIARQPILDATLTDGITAMSKALRYIMATIKNDKDTTNQ
ncbi:MAG: ribonuclease P protein component [Alphaproteobacteria bacterium]|nr:ribonuclease P protein component [Alphaproteobacteria bacterium]